MAGNRLIGFLVCSTAAVAAFMPQSLRENTVATHRRWLVGLSVAPEEGEADGRKQKQNAIREVLKSRKPHQKKSCVFPGTRVLVIMSEDLKNADKQSPEEKASRDAQGLLPVEVETLYEAIIEEVVTKEKSHPLGIKVRVVGGKSGRVARILETHDNALEIAKELGANDCRKASANKGIRTQLLSVGNKKWTPYSTSADQWMPKGPAAKAAALLEELGELEDDKSPKLNKKQKYGESGHRKMKRIVEEQNSIGSE